MYLLYITVVYSIGVGTSPGLDDVVEFVNVSSDTFSFCADNLELKHKETYYSTVVAYNGGHKELSVNASSDGGR